MLENPVAARHLSWNSNLKTPFISTSSWLPTSLKVDTLYFGEGQPWSRNMGKNASSHRTLLCLGLWSVCNTVFKEFALLIRRRRNRRQHMDKFYIETIADSVTQHTSFAYNHKQRRYFRKEAVVSNAFSWFFTTTFPHVRLFVSHV